MNTQQTCKASWGVHRCMALPMGGSPYCSVHYRSPKHQPSNRREVVWSNWWETKHWPPTPWENEAEQRENR